MSERNTGGEKLTNKPEPKKEGLFGSMLGYQMSALKLETHWVNLVC